MPESLGRIRSRKFSAFTIDEIVLGKSEKRFGLIPGRNIKLVRFISSKAFVPFECFLLIVDSSRTSVSKPRFFSIRLRERKWNERLHARKDYLGNALGTLRGIPATEAVIIPWKIKEVLLKSLPVSSAKVPQATLAGRIRWQYWSDRTGNGNKIVIGGAQRREKIDRVSGRMSGEK